MLQMIVHNFESKTILIRISSIDCFTPLLIQYPMNNRIAFYWINAILPLVQDTNFELEKKVVETLKTVILDNVVKNEETDTPLHYLPWKLITLIKGKMDNMFEKVCSIWTNNEDYMLPNVFEVVRSHLDTVRNNSALYFLIALTKDKCIEDATFILEYFYTNVYDVLCLRTAFEEERLFLANKLLVLNYIVLKDEELLTLRENIYRLLSEFMVPLKIIDVYISMSYFLASVSAFTPEEYYHILYIWTKRLIMVCQQKLTVKLDSSSPIDFETYRSIFTLCYSAQICAASVSNNNIMALVQLLELDLKNVEPDTEEWKKNFRPTMQKLIVKTIGHHDLVAKNFANSATGFLFFVINTAQFLSVRVCAMDTLSDLFKRNSSLVESWMQKLINFLRDENVVIIIKALTMMINIMKNDFSKLYSPLFLHLLTMINADVNKINDLIGSFISNTVYTSPKTTVAVLFIESLFYFNECTIDQFLPNPDMYLEMARERRVKQSFMLSGKHKAVKRHRIYDFILEKLPGYEIVFLIHKICTGIIVGVIHEGIMLGANGKALLQDALYILSRKPVKLKIFNPKCSGNKEGEIEEELKMMMAKQFEMKEEFTVSVQEFFSFMVILKRKLVSLWIPLDDLKRCMVEIMRDYKQEIVHIARYDRNFAAEISSEFKKEETAQKQQLTEQFSKMTVGNAVMGHGEHRMRESEIKGARTRLEERVPPIMSEYYFLNSFNVQETLCDENSSRWPVDRLSQSRKSTAVEADSDESKFRDSTCEAKVEKTRNERRKKYSSNKKHRK